MHLGSCGSRRQAGRRTSGQHDAARVRRLPGHRGRTARGRGDGADRRTRVAARHERAGGRRAERRRDEPDAAGPAGRDVPARARRARCRWIRPERHRVTRGVRRRPRPDRGADHGDRGGIPRRVRGPARGHPGLPRPVSRAGCTVRRGELGAGMRPPGRRDRKPDRRRLADHHRSSTTTPGCWRGGSRPPTCCPGGELPGPGRRPRRRPRPRTGAGVPDSPAPPAPARPSAGWRGRRPGPAAPARRAVSRCAPGRNSGLPRRLELRVMLAV